MASRRIAPENHDFPLLTRDQVAKLLGRDPEYVRKFLARRGIQEQRGYRRSEVEPLIGYQPQQGRRTDLLKPAAPDADPCAYTSPTQLARDITDRLRADHRDCPPFTFGACHLAHLTTDDVQEILNLITEQEDSRG